MLVPPVALGVAAVGTVPVAAMSLLLALIAVGGGTRAPARGLTVPIGLGQAEAPLVYCERTAAVGDTRVARRAGSRLAASAINSSAAATAAKVNGSFGATS